MTKDVKRHISRRYKEVAKKGRRGSERSEGTYIKRWYKVVARGKLCKSKQELLQYIDGFSFSKLSNALS